jgi:tRNA modification GTPase
MTDTIVAVATPSGESALAIIRLSGNTCKKIISQCFTTPSPTPRHSYLSEYKNKQGENIDQVIWCYYQNGKSFTGEEMLEISCHGNQFIIDEILQDLLSLGVRVANPGEFTKRAYLSKKIDLVQAEAIASIISAKSTKEAKLSKKNLEGNLSSRIIKLQSNMLNTLSRVEAFIDFPEDDLGKSQSLSIISQIAHDHENISNLSSAYHRNRKLLSKQLIALVGSPNAGKSTLFNCLVGYDRSIVSSEQGTTRDYVSQDIIINDYRVNLVDTAGLREAQDTIESTGVQNTLEQIERADLLILVLDASVPYPSELSAYIKNTFNRKKIIIVENKNDLKRKISNNVYPDCFCIQSISAKDHKGIEDIISAITKCLQNDTSEDSEINILINLRQYSSLIDASESLEKAKILLEKNDDYLLAAIEIRESLHQIGEIVGQTDNDAMLDKLFSNFCIGK